jgi:hypothetical protein
MGWMHDPQKVQAVSSVILAVLTLVLIVVTIVYTAAARRTAKIMRDDLSLRTEPIVEGEVEFKHLSLTATATAIVRVTATHSPTTVERIVLSVTYALGDRFETELIEPSQYQLIGIGRTIEFSRQVDAMDHQGEPADWILVVRYRNVFGKDLYETAFKMNGQSERRIVKKG